MEIKKTDEEVVYITKRDTITFEVGKDKKEVKVYNSFTDSSYGDFDSDYEIDEEDKKELTEEELELFEDNLSELLADIKVGETLEVEEE